LSFAWLKASWLGVLNEVPEVPSEPNEAVFARVVTAEAFGAIARRTRAAASRPIAKRVDRREGAPLLSAGSKAPRVARARRIEPRPGPLPEVDPADDAFAWRLT
jgi:hypothetical protein